MTEKCEFCDYPLANYQDQVEHSSLAHPNVDPERTNGSVSPAQTENRNENNTELTCDHTDDDGFCWCESDVLRCPNCRGWLGLGHANKDVHAMSDRPTQSGIANFYKRGLEVGDYTINDILMMLAGYETVIQTRTPYPVDVTRVQLTTPKGSPAQMDTTEYPPEGQNAECPHTDDTGLCYCESGVQMNQQKPFPHAIIENYLDANRAALMFAELNAIDVSTWHYDLNVSAHQVNKRWMDDLSKLPATVASVLVEMNSTTVLQQMEQLTGIDNLIPDYTYLGGGVHVTETGGRLDLHADFNMHPVTGLHRRVNALLYLNPDWDYRWGGELELHKDGEVKKIEPLMNRLVVFPITDSHIHGQPIPLTCPSHRKRFSLALYYYTENRPENEKAPFHWADWKKQ